MRFSLQVALDGRRLTFSEAGPQVTTLTLPATGGSPAGTAGIAFGCEQNRGQAGGQQADDIVITAFHSFAGLPVINSFPQPDVLAASIPTAGKIQITWPQSGYGTYTLEVSDNLSDRAPYLLPPVVSSV